MGSDYPINPLFVDLSHHDPAEDYSAVKDAGYVGCVYKATEGTDYTDDTYVSQQTAAKAVGLKWGSYHFADGSNVSRQIDNYLKYAFPDPDELFCLDWEDNGGDTMDLEDAKTWIKEVENALKREGECVLYSGNTAKEALGDEVDTFLGARRLWLCQYGDTPTWQRSWDRYDYYWQFTDGVYGPNPHIVDGIGPCDINSYDGTPEELATTWASGQVQPAPPPVLLPKETVAILVAAPTNVRIIVRRLGTTQASVDRRKRRQWRQHEAQ